MKRRVEEGVLDDGFGDRSAGAAGSYKRRPGDSKPKKIEIPGAQYFRKRNSQ